MAKKSVKKPQLKPALETSGELSGTPNIETPNIETPNTETPTASAAQAEQVTANGGSGEAAPRLTQPAQAGAADTAAAAGNNLTPGNAWWTNSVGERAWGKLGLIAGGLVGGIAAIAGNNRSSGNSSDTTPPVAPTLALKSDTGTSATDGITNDGTIAVGGLETGATWQYSLDNGVTWTAGNGSSFVLAAGSYAAGSVSVRQTDAAGNVSTPATNTASITIDTTAPAAPSLALKADSGTSATDGITNDGTIAVGGLETGATWQYSLDNGVTWTAGSGSSFMLAAGSYAAGSVSVRQTDAAGNVSTPATNAASITIDTMAPSPSLTLKSDTGTSATDGITNDGTIAVGGLETGASWQYSLDNGVTWTTGNGSSFVLAAGSYAAGSVSVRQTDAAGNVSTPAVTTASITVDITAPAAPSATAASSQYMLEGVTGTGDFSPQISAVGSDGSFVVTWAGDDASGTSNIYVQKFDATGAKTGTQHMLEGVTGKNDVVPQVSAVGSDGSFVVTWKGYDGTSDNIYVQKFDATGAKTGSLHILEGLTGENDVVPQVSAVGSDGSFVVTWAGNDASGYGNIYEQKFDASGAKTGTQHMLEGVAGTDDYLPQISAVGSDGSFVVTWQGDGPIYGTIYVQKFDATGAPTGSQHMQEGVAGNDDFSPQISAVGSDGSFVVTWKGYDGTSNNIYVQKFDATGAKVSGLGATGVGAEAGVLYLVSDTVTVSGLSSVTGAADALWNQVSTIANASSPLDATGLLDGSYHLYLADLAGNLSAMDAAALTVTVGVIHA